MFNSSIDYILSLLHPHNHNFENKKKTAKEKGRRVEAVRICEAILDGEWTSCGIAQSRFFRLFCNLQKGNRERFVLDARILQTLHLVEGLLTQHS